MDLLRSLLATAGAGGEPGPFALLRREGADHLDVLRGELDVVDRLADLPLPAAGPAGPRTLALVPHRQLTERGLTCVDDAMPLECLRVDEHVRIPLATALAALPDRAITATGGHFDLSDEQYAETVSTVLREEIGRGEGANFVIHRVYSADLDTPPLAAGLAALRRLLLGERGAYWTFLVHTGTRTLVGATPERHVSVEAGLVMMNPISGTHWLPATGPDPAALLRFLADPKEIDELYMVLDEELKMMARVAERGGEVIGPQLKQMAHLVHTEYLLAGRGDADVRDVLRETMFAPTVTGSPLDNALRVIARHERRGRRYYGGVCALLGRDEAGRQTLDAPILIRTAEITPDGRLRVPVGATLVRHSTAAGEVAETYTKAAGILAALGLRPPAGPLPTSPTSLLPTSLPPTVRDATDSRRDLGQPSPDGPRVPLAADPRIAGALAARNTHLAPFWLRRGEPGTAAVPALTGRSALIVDAEDSFAGMLAHLLRELGLAVTLRPWDQAAGQPVQGTDGGGRGPDGGGPGAQAVGPGAAGGDPGADGGDLGADGGDPGAADGDHGGAGFDLVVAGPGPGDPDDVSDVKMATMRRVIADRLAARRPLLGVCLGHQLLAGLLGLRLHRRDAPYQGLARTIDLFGRPCRVGFYSTFTAMADSDELATAYGPVRLALDRTDGSVHALRGAAFTGVQFHPESVLSEDGLPVLRDLLAELLTSSFTPAPRAAAASPGTPSALGRGAGTGLEK
ncbi:MULTISPECIES: anthranilate synthase family protein [Frankia]|nr:MULTISPECIES: anthranilate synthase family protein [Frankia]